MRNVAAFFVAVMLAGTLAPAAAFAQALTPAQRKQADQHFADAKRLFEQEAWDEALAAFEAANAIAPHPVVLANIGLCHERAGRYVKALEVYRSFIADPNVTDDKADEIWARIDALEAQVGRIEVSCPVTECTIVVDGTDRGPAPVVVAVEPGAHAVQAVHAAVAFEPARIEVGVGAVVPVAMVPAKAAPEPEPEPPPPPPPPAEPEGISLGAPFWIATGVTAAGGIGIIAFGARTLKLKDDYEAADRLDSGVREDGEQSRLATNVMIGITGAAAAAATAFLIHALVADPDGEEPVARTMLAPVIGEGAGLAVAGEF